MHQNTRLPPLCVSRPLCSAQVSEGQTLLVPSGWIQAIAAPCDTLAVSGQLLHGFALPTELAAHQVELLLGAPGALARRQPQQLGGPRAPLFRHVMWHAAMHYAKALRSLAGGWSGLWEWCAVR